MQHICMSEAYFVCFSTLKTFNRQQKSSEAYFKAVEVLTWRCSDCISFRVQMVISPIETRVQGYFPQPECRLSSQFLMLQCQHRDYWWPTLKTLRSQHLVRSRHPYTGNRRYMWGVFTEMSRGERNTQTVMLMQTTSLLANIHRTAWIPSVQALSDPPGSLYVCSFSKWGKVQKMQTRWKLMASQEAGSGKRRVPSDWLISLSCVCARSCLCMKTKHNPRLLLTPVPHIRWNRTIQTTSTQVLTAQTSPELSVQSWAKNTTRRGDEISCDHYSQTNTAQHRLGNCLQLCKLFILLLFPPFCDPIPVVSSLLLLKQNAAPAKSPSLLNSFRMIHKIPQEHHSFEKSQLIF